MDYSTPDALFITSPKSLLKLMPIESVMPSNHLILCRPLLLLPSIFPSIRVCSNESTLRMRWPKYWSFSFSISPSSEYSGLISFRIQLSPGHLRSSCPPVEARVFPSASSLPTTWVSNIQTQGARPGGGLKMPWSPYITRLLPPQTSKGLTSSSSVRVLFQSASHLLTPLLTPPLQAGGELCSQKRRGPNSQDLRTDLIYRPSLQRGSI